VLPPGLLVVHDSSRGGEDDVAELTRWQQLDDPLLEVTELDVVAGRDDTGLVDPVITLSAAAACCDWRDVDLPSVKLDNNLAVAVVVDLLEFANVAWKDDMSVLNVSKN
jgi:hypothetical protein